ncbi:MAG: aminoacetone oxidase family FAD-binding enzyme [Clostridia bacterium]|nr:aminoacetone oxidase family FAD-binding enzyme [Clostridia bacterium]
MLDIAVIGGGAAGLSAAISAARQNKNLKICVFEQLDRVGKKIAVTGNGRCNITNINLSADKFHTKSPTFVEDIFTKITHEDIAQFFEALGVPFYSEADGREYPASLQAASVTDALRFECETQNIELCCGCRVEDIKKQGGCFELLVDGKKFDAKKVIIATGGLAGGQKLGCDGAGFKLAASLGHTKTPLLPAIVQLKTDNRIVRQLKGIKVDCLATAIVNGRAVRREFGEVLFCDYGLSGPPILQLSSVARQNSQICLDLMCKTDLNALTQIIYERSKRFSARPLSEFFTGILNKRLGQVIIKEQGLSLTQSSGDITEKMAARLAKTIKCFTFTVTGDCGHNNAQATLGGINTSELDSITLESKKHKGLYLVGELLDVCGDCGGYNLSFAWASGMLAGKAAASSL